MVAVRCQPHDSCPRSRVKDHRIRVGNLVLFDPFQAARHKDFPVRLHWRKSKVMQNQLALLGRSPQTGKGGGASTSSLMIHSSQEPSPKAPTPTKQQGTPQNPGTPTPKRGEKGEEKKGGGTKGAAPEREKPTREGSPGAPRISPSRALFPSPGAGLGLSCGQGGDVSALGSCPPPGCAAPPFRMAAVLDDHTAPFAMSSMRLSAAASGFRRINSQMASETWPVWVVRLNLKRGTFWSTTETSRSGAEGSTRR